MPGKQQLTFKQLHLCRYIPIINFLNVNFFRSKVSIKQATGLPPSLSNYVFCQYSFWNHPDVQVVSADPSNFTFNHDQDFTIPITEEFIEHCSGKDCLLLF